jgi:hypothetical protein
MFPSRSYGSILTKFMFAQHHPVPIFVHDVVQ